MLSNNVKLGIYKRTYYMSFKTKSCMNDCVKLLYQRTENRVKFCGVVNRISDETVNPLL